MEHFALVTVSVYKKRKLSTQAVTKQELPNCHAEQNPTYQNELLKGEMNKTFLPK